MIGIFDSGVGGYNALTEIRRLLPRQDIIYLADSANAPYGTKSKEELYGFIKHNIGLLRERGAEKILVACCTASVLCDGLDIPDRGSVYTVAEPAAREAAKGERIAVIATERTVSEKAFTSLIKKQSPTAAVIEIAAQELVGTVENGARDRKITTECDKILSELCDSIKRFEADTLVLGCTHFSHLMGEFSARLDNIHTVSPAHVGARALAKAIKEEKRAAAECGRIIYLQTASVR